VLCAYPSSRRSRNTQPTNIDPFIDNLSQLEGRIRQIESVLESQRSIIQEIVSGDDKSEKILDISLSKLVSQMRKTEDEVQDSRSILAQLRLRGEQRIAKSKRAQSPIKPENTSNEAISEDDEEESSSTALSSEDSRSSHTSEMPSISSSPRASISSSSCSSTPTHINSAGSFGMISYGGSNAFGVHSSDSSVSMGAQISFGQLGDQVSELMLGSQSTMFTSPSCGQYNTQDINSFMFAHNQHQNYSLPQQPSPTSLQDADLVAAVHAFHNGQEVWYC
jgi:hypothetical protein